MKNKVHSPLYHALQYRHITKTFHLLLSAHALRIVQFWLESVNNEGTLRVEQCTFSAVSRLVK
jgi:hypothetical protein